MKEVSLLIEPDDEDAEAAGIFVEGRLGRRSYRFLLDTGAGRSCVECDDYTSGFAAVGTHRSSGVFAQSSDDLVAVPSLEVGPIVRRDVTLVRSPRVGPRTKSLIGMDILKDFRFHFLFREGRALIDPEDSAGDMPSLQELHLDAAFHPYVTVEVGAVQAQAVWDTGAGITVVDLGFVHEHPAHFQEAGQSLGTDATGAQLHTPMFIVGPTKIRR